MPEVAGPQQCREPGLLVGTRVAPGEQGAALLQRLTLPIAASSAFADQLRASSIRLAIMRYMAYPASTCARTWAGASFGSTATEVSYASRAPSPFLLTQQ